LAENTPTLFNVYVSSFLDQIWSALRDPKTPIREGAIEALRAALRDIARRDMRWKRECGAKLFAEAVHGLKGDQVNSVHGSLLTIGWSPVPPSPPLFWCEADSGEWWCAGELLKYTGDFLATRFKEVCDIVLKYKTSSLPSLSLYPPSATFCSYVCYLRLLWCGVQIQRQQK
jgi:FKBP12-rapamycin complex-associated protein